MTAGPPKPHETRDALSKPAPAGVLGIFSSLEPFPLSHFLESSGSGL